MQISANCELVVICLNICITYKPMHQQPILALIGTFKSVIGPFPFEKDFPERTIDSRSRSSSKKWFYFWFLRLIQTFVVNLNVTCMIITHFNIKHIIIVFFVTLVLHQIYVCTFILPLCGLRWFNNNLW